MLVRAFGLPERAVLEGQFGTKAEAEAHADLAIANMELRHQVLVQDINWHVVNQLLRLNWGEDSEGMVYLQPAPIADLALSFLRQLIISTLTQPEGFATFISGVDIESLYDRMNIPILPDANFDAVGYNPQDVPAVSRRGDGEEEEMLSAALELAQPRVPKGDQHGGRFASKKGGAGGGKSSASKKKPSNRKAKAGRGGEQPKQPMSEKAKRAKKAHKMVDKTIQRQADVQEAKFAKEVGGASFKNSEPLDVVVADATGRVAHGIEHKFMVDNSNNKITMDKYAQVRKVDWERRNKATVHTVVQTNDGKTFYRRGVGSARVGGMHEVKGGAKEVKKLLGTPDAKLPKAAQRTDAKLRQGVWKPTKGERGYVNSKTGDIARPKK
jgi:hypothetical protein